MVPYNKTLLKKYQAHINVEWCNQASSIKYLFKYINKGPDRATVSLVQTTSEDPQAQSVDEIKEYYISMTPSVTRLPFHLPGQQHLFYGADADIDDVLDNPSVSSLMFLSWMKCNEDYEEARRLTYVEFPTRFVWKPIPRSWEPRQRGFSVGRIHSVPPSLVEAYYLRVLLNRVKGPRLFEEIRTVNGRVFPTFREACYSLGLLDDEKEYIEAIEESSHSATGPFLRTLFSTMLTSNSLSRPEYVWEKTWQKLSDDILHKQRILLKKPELQLNEDKIKNLTLFNIETILLRNSSTLHNFPTMPYPDHDSLSASNNHLILQELAYDHQDLKAEFDNLIISLTSEQRNIFNEIMSVVEGNKGEVFFVYGYGGTGKTYLWKTLSTAIRSKGQIVLNVASSGIASSLLTGGRTAHSRFLIPFNLNEDSICYIKPNSDIANLIKKAKLIVWDEAPMIHKHGFESLDITLKDIMPSESFNNSQLSFGGKVIVFGGDFRQILPVNSEWIQT